MNRRGFIKIAALTSVSFPILANSKDDDFPDFDPNKCYYDHCIITDVVSGLEDEVVKIAIRLQNDQIRLAIPEKYIHKVRRFFINGCAGNFDPLCQRSQVWWIYGSDSDIERIKCLYRIDLKEITYEL